MSFWKYSDDIDDMSPVLRCTLNAGFWFYNGSQSYYLHLYGPMR